MDTEKNMQQETGSQETGSQETGSQEIGSQEIGSQEIGSQEIGSQEIGSQETGSQETGSQETGSQETTNDVNNDIQEIDLHKQLKEEKNKFLRLYAEFDNYKKRSHKEKIELIRYGGKEVLSDLIPVIDDFERAIKEIEKYQQNQMFSGIQLIQNKLLNILKEKGLNKMEVEIGDEFNSDKHEAITQIPATNEELKNKIVDIIETGYILHDKIIRFAKVVVGS